MKITCFSKRKLNVRAFPKRKLNLQYQDFPKIAAFWENPEKNWSNLAKNSAKIQQILANFATFCKNQQKIQQFLTKKLRFQNGAKECIVQISARAFQRVFTCKIWL